MRIRVEQFCNLSTNSQWQAWLYKYDSVLYQDLINHLRTTRGCSHNREKMVELMGVIESRSGGQNAIMEFLKSSFPSIIDYDGEVVSSAIPVTVAPFEWNGTQLTFPRRIILQHVDVNVLLENVKSFISDEIRVEYVIIGNKAYIEYVPSSHARILNQIPVKNWRVPVFKKTYGLK